MRLESLILSGADAIVLVDDGDDDDRVSGGTMSEQNTAPTAKRPSRLLAFVLNLIVPPSGYVYAGSIGCALAYVIILAAAPSGLIAWTWFHPPGVYGYLNEHSTAEIGKSVLAVGLLVLAVLGCHAAVVAGRRRSSRRPASATWMIAIVLIAAPFLLLVVIRDAIPISIYPIVGELMEPTLETGDVVSTIGSRMICGWVGVHAGDIVMYRQDLSSSRVNMQRAIAGPGALVEIRQGVVVVDHAPLRLTPLGNGFVPFHPGVVQGVSLFDETDGNGPAHKLAIADSTARLENLPAIRVPKDSWFLLGDNRDDAEDSRYLGPIRQENICGVARQFVWTRKAGQIGRRP